MRESGLGPLDPALAPPLFANRREAGRQLARELEDEPAENAVVVGLARGGVVVAAEVARALRLPLDVVAVRKVGHPWQPEYAIGAVAPGGPVYLRGHDGLTEEEARAAAAAAEAEAEALERRLHAEHAPLDLRGKTCLLVDDGLATGASMTAAVRWAKRRGALRVLVAVPVAAPEAVARLQREADVVCVAAPPALLAVGQWYSDFRQVSDDEVTALLDEEARETTNRKSPPPD